MNAVKKATTAEPRGRSSPIKWYLGLMMASIFSLVYFVAPFYMVSALVFLLSRYPSPLLSWLYAAPFFVSAILPPIAMPWILKYFSPMLDYFEYEEIHESSPVNVMQEILKGKNYLLIVQPHGALSFCGIASAINIPKEFMGQCGFPTAVANAVLYTPILKHVLGVFGLISASKDSMIKTLRKPGAPGCVVLYVGGMAELFLSCENEEKLYLKSRKGFIKLALTQGVDVVPVYMFGNTAVLSVLKTGLLAAISRKLQVSLTYIWGKWYLPIPRDTKLLYVSGQPLGMPKIEKPTQQDIDHWHGKYCEQVKSLFEKYKEKVPEYKHKKLDIV